MGNRRVWRCPLGINPFLFQTALAVILGNEPIPSSRRFSSSFTVKRSAVWEKTRSSWSDSLRAEARQSPDQGTGLFGKERLYSFPTGVAVDQCARDAHHFTPVANLVSQHPQQNGGSREQGGHRWTMGIASNRAASPRRTSFHVSSKPGFTTRARTQGTTVIVKYLWGRKVFQSNRPAHPRRALSRQ